MFKRRRSADDFAAEIQAHLELEADELKSEGASEDEAHRKARVEFGNLHVAQERFQLRSRLVWLDNLLRDVRFATRQLLRNRGFATTAILTLALGIGANTAIFSLVNTLLLKPLPVPHPEQIATLVLHENHGSLEQSFSWNEFKLIRAQSKQSFSGIFAWTMNLDGLAVRGQRPDRIMAMYVSGSFFDTFGLKPAAGRLFLPSEGETLGKDPVVVLGYDYWQQKFGGDPNMVGRAVSLNGHPVTIIGVAPQGFHGMQPFLSMAAYVPLSELSFSGVTATQINDGQFRMFFINSRLRNGVSPKQATASLEVTAQNLTRLYPDVEKNLSIEAHPETELRVGGGDPKLAFFVAELFLSSAVLVLVLACVNVANLVLVRATTRAREMAVRTALGAQRARLVGQMITESILLATLGGITGVALGMFASSSLSQLNLHIDLPVRFTFAFDWHIFLYSFAVALLGGLVVSVAPALHVARANVSSILHEGGRSVASGRHWGRDGLVALQIAGSLVLLVVAALFVRSLSAMQKMDFGFNPDHVMNFTIDAKEIGMDDAQARDLANQLTTRLHQLAGIRAVSHAMTVPLSYFVNSGSQLIIDGAPVPTNPADMVVGYNIVSPEYFDVMGIALARGRTFTDADNEHGQDVAIVSESTARKFWPQQDPIGRTLRMGDTKDRIVKVVGIARDAEFHIWAGAKRQPYIYIPYAQHFKGSTLMVFQLRSDRDVPGLGAEGEQVIHSLAPQLPVFQVQTMREALYTMNGLLLFQIGASLAAIMGALGLLLAVIGLYGVVSYAVGCRVHEIGLRMALGASRGSVFRMIYGQSIVILAIGLGAGLVIALLVARAVDSMVIVSVWSPATYALVIVVLALAALSSTYLPARRAMELQPMIALRED
jgi:putative ABC transport system permease protein